jgi:hypothetical protein
MDSTDRAQQNASHGANKRPRTLLIPNPNPCKSMKLRMVIGGWTDYYVNHSDNWAAFNVHGVRVVAHDNNPDSDVIIFQWGFNTLRTTIGGIVRTLTMIDKCLEV